MEIVKVAVGWQHTVGLKSDGTVVAVGDNYYGRSAMSAAGRTSPRSLQATGTR